MNYACRYINAIPTLALKGEPSAKAKPTRSPRTSIGESSEDEGQCSYSTDYGAGYLSSDSDGDSISKVTDSMDSSLEDRGIDGVQRLPGTGMMCGLNKSISCMLGMPS